MRYTPRAILKTQCCRNCLGISGVSHLWEADCTMTSTEKSAKQPLKLTHVVLIMLLIFVVIEIWLQQQQLGIKSKACSSSALTGIPKEESTAGAIRIPVLVKSPTVHEFFTRDNVVHWDNLTELAPEGLRTSIDTSDGDEARFMRYGLSPLRNVCIRPNGTIVVVGVSKEEFSSSLTEAMALEWKETYNCSWGCKGAAFENSTPTGALWINGTTTHIVPYLGNVFHNFAERVWPHLTSGNVPSRYYVHHMHTWLDQAHHNIDRNTLMFQLALLAGNTTFLQHTEDETRPLCFASLTLCSATAGKMSPKLGLGLFSPAISRYRESAFTSFAIPAPSLPLPPSRLRVTLYGRSDASRRRISNIAEVATFLRSSTHPPLLVTSIDDMMQSGLYNQTLPEVVSLMAQTDVFITPHGANTWATLFMPKRAAVIEVYGPCGPATWIGETVVKALALKHETEGNPWGLRVRNAKAGNTTECRNSLETPDFSINVEKLAMVMKRLGRVDGTGDRVPLHWIFDWRRNAY